MDQIRRFRITALAEGSSFLVLLCIAMPMKYVMEMPRVVTVVGAIHGILFLAYVAQLVQLRTTLRWSNRVSFYAFLASLLPFGPFVFDKYLREKEVDSSSTI
ncbi:MAG: DUF3817 domain-containing protein [Nitrospira sp.]|nr:DUF3817 domain-containing protein [Nitrospira sp.]